MYFWIKFIVFSIIAYFGFQAFKEGEYLKCICIELLIFMAYFEHHINRVIEAIEK